MIMLWNILTSNSLLLPTISLSTMFFINPNVFEVGGCWQASTITLWLLCFFTPKKKKTRDTCHAKKPIVPIQVNSRLQFQHLCLKRDLKLSRFLCARFHQISPTVFSNTQLPQFLQFYPLIKKHQTQASVHFSNIDNQTSL